MVHRRKKHCLFKICQSLHGKNSEQQQLGGAVLERIEIWGADVFGSLPTCALKRNM